MACLHTLLDRVDDDIRLEDIAPDCNKSADKAVHKNFHSTDELPLHGWFMPVSPCASLLLR